MAVNSIMPLKWLALLSITVGLQIFAEYQHTRDNRLKSINNAVCAYMNKFPGFLRNNDEISGRQTFSQTWVGNARKNVRREIWRNFNTLTYFFCLRRSELTPCLLKVIIHSAAVLAQKCPNVDNKSVTHQQARWPRLQNDKVGRSSPRDRCLYEETALG